MATTKRPRDVNAIAAAILAEATREGDMPRTDDGKNAAAVALGKLGGAKGGKARAAALSKKRRSEIAKAAAAARWKKK